MNLNIKISLPFLSLCLSHTQSLRLSLSLFSLPLFISITNSLSLSIFALSVFLSYTISLSLFHTHIHSLSVSLFLFLPLSRSFSLFFLKVKSIIIMESVFLVFDLLSLHSKKQIMRTKLLCFSFCMQ